MYFRGGKGGRVTGSVTAVQLPDVPCAGVTVRATAGTVVLGDASVTATNGLRIAAADVPLFLPLANLNALWMIGGTANDHLEYLAYR